MEGFLKIINKSYHLLIFVLKKIFLDFFFSTLDAFSYVWWSLGIRSCLKGKALNSTETEQKSLYCTMMRQRIHMGPLKYQYAQVFSFGPVFHENSVSCLGCMNLVASIQELGKRRERGRGEVVFRLLGKLISFLFSDLPPPPSLGSSHLEHP